MTKEFDGFDLIVAGCSAAGAFAARDASSLGLKTLVLEEHARSGKQGKCSGLVSVSGLKLLGAAGTEFDASVVNEVRGAVLHAKGEKSAEFVVERRNAVARVLDRQKFDEALARQARAAGAKLLFNHRVTTIKQNGKSMVVRCGDGSKFAAKFLVGADGAASRVAAACDFPKLPKLVLGYEAEFAGARVERDDFVDLFFDSQAFPGFFAWIIPAGKRGVRMGFATRKIADFAFAKNKFYALPAVQSVARQARARKTREYAAVIPLTVRRKTQFGRVLLVGDAAGQTKASTGGGIVFGGLCAGVAAASVKNAVDSNSNAFPDYEASWRRAYGGKLALHSLARLALDSLDDETLKALFAVGKRLGAPSLLSRFGDMDFVFK